MYASTGAHPPCETAASRAPVISLIVLAFLLRIGVAAALGELGTDQARYHEYEIAARRLVQTGIFASPFQPDDAPIAPSAALAPIYVWITAAAYLVFGVQTTVATLALQIMNAAASCLTVGVTFLAAQALAGRTVGLMAATLVTINPLLTGFCTYVWDTSLFTLGVGLSVLFAVRLGSRPPQAVRFLAFGLWLGLLAMLNPALTAAYPLLVLWPAVRTDSTARRAIGTCLIAAAGWAVAVAPWTLRNYAQLGEITYARSTLKHELWMGVCPAADQNPKEVFHTHFVLGNPELLRHAGDVGEKAYFAECGRQAWKAILDQPRRYVRLCAIRLVDFWAGTVRSHTDPEAIRWWPNSPLRLVTALFLAVEAFWAAYVIVAKRGVQGRLWLGACALAFSLLYVVMHVMLRYRAPIEPILASLCGLVVVQRLPACSKAAVNPQ